MSSTQNITLQRFVLKKINGGTYNLELTCVLRESKEMKREMHKRFQLLLKYFVFFPTFSLFLSQRFCLALSFVSTFVCYFMFPFLSFPLSLSKLSRLPWFSRSSSVCLTSSACFSLGEN